MVDALAHRIGPALLEPGEPFVLHDLELALRQGGLAEDLAEDLENGGKVGPLGLHRVRQGPDRRRRPASPAAHAAAQPGEVLVEGVLDLLAVEVLGASQHQARQETGRLDLSLEVFGGAVVQGQVHVNRIAPRLLGQQCQLDALDRVGPLDARLDGQGRDVERLARGLNERGPCSPRRSLATSGVGGTGFARAWHWG